MVFDFFEGMELKEIAIAVMGFLLVIGIIYIVYDLVSGYFNVSSEGFKVRSQNFVTNNRFDNANRLGYGSPPTPGLYSEKSPAVAGPSSVQGVNKNSGVDVYDNRGFKWNYNGNSPEINSFTDNANDAELRNRFERTYMLDPSGSVAQYDLSYNKMSPNCCPAQYGVPFKVTAEGESNCDYAQKYVANQYSGSNFDSNASCVCVSPAQADFYGNRGGNGGLYYK